MENLANITGKTELATGQIVSRGFSDTRLLSVQDNAPCSYMLEARTDGWRVAETEFGAQWVRLTGTGKWSATWNTFAARVERADMTTETVETETGFAIVAGVGTHIGMAWVRADELAK